METPKSCESDLDAIRISLYEQTKDMSVTEKIHFFNDKGMETAKEFGLIVVNDVAEAVYPHLKKATDAQFRL